MNTKKYRWAAGALIAVMLTVIMPSSFGSFCVYADYGPGMADVYKDSLPGIIDDSPNGDFGPKVEVISLSEKYYEEYECYSEGFSGAAFIYSNVSNDGMTDKSVYVDIPANVSYKLEKDGVEIPYESKTYLSEHGSYRFQMEVVKNPDDPVSEQTIYRGVFNFRIATKTNPKTTGTGTSGSWLSPTNIITPPVTVPETEPVPAETTAEAKIVFEEDEEDEETELKIEEETENAPEEPDVPEEHSHELSYDTAGGFYTKTFEDGTFFSANVASGVPVNYAVEIDASGLPGGAESIRVLKDDEETEMPEDLIFREAGDYELQIPVESGSYYYSFMIFDHPVKGPLSIKFPEWTEMNSVTVDGEESGYLTDGNDRVYVDLTREGTYVLKFTDDNLQNYETEITVDLTAPVVKAQKSGKQIVFSYDSEDEIDHVVIRDGNSEYEQTIIREIREPGSYSIDFYDEAGNCSNLEVTLKKSVNAASVIAILILIGIIAGGVVFFWRVRNKAVIK